MSIIKVEGLGKSYTISHEERERYTALRDVMARKAKKIFSFNNSTNKQIHSSTKEEFWALKDINFEVQQGDRIGIIGRNGAGKSTLLKILSRITEPTTGSIKIKGRVASLLEVGTGFHPELTGAENIYLNGAILGMSRNEVKKKFDEIVDFAEVEKFLDTPVKRYSSGMYVRLAFAVAAHLEPEILVVDEVLAVGDAEFQKKCLGKMEDVSKNEGRTVLFVSHNMAAVKSLTSTSLLLEKGDAIFIGNTLDAIETYSKRENYKYKIDSEVKGQGQHSKIKSIQLIDKNESEIYDYNPLTEFILKIILETSGVKMLTLDLFLVAENKTKIGMASLSHFEGIQLPNKPGLYEIKINLGNLFLASGDYSIDLTTAIINTNWDHYVQEAINFNVIEYNPNNLVWSFKQLYNYGYFALVCKEKPQISLINNTLER